MRSRVFRMYHQEESSCFDFFDNALEPAQTKGLGYLLTQSDEALKVFTSMCGIKLGRIKDYNVIVNCEYGYEDCRFDILLRVFDMSNQPKHAILVEAKSINLVINPSDVIAQANNYRNKYSFLLQGFPNDNVKIAVLTKACPASVVLQEIVYISWEELITKLFEIQPFPIIVKEYINFITQKNTKMKTHFYDQEVLSIAAGDTYESVKSLRIYVCQNNRFKPHPLYITFRKRGGGSMEKLYKIKGIINDLNFERDETYEIIDAMYLGVAEKIREWKKKHNVSGLSQLIILEDESMDIVLPYLAKPEKNNVDRAGWSYNLSDFFKTNPGSANKIVILPRRS